MNTTARNLRINTKKILETVSRGEEVVITFHGKPCAKIVPFDETVKKKGKGSDLFGIWKDRTDLDDVNSYVRNIRRGRFYEND